MKVVPSCARKARRAAEFVPTGGLITGTLIALRIYKGLGQHDAMAVNPNPILLESPRDHAKNTTGQIGATFVGEDEKSAVLSYEP